MVEREKEMWMVKVWSHGCEVSEYEVEDRQCLYMHPGQSRILSCRYFWLSCGSPGGSITSGSCSGRGFQSWWFFVRRVSVFSSASHRIFTTTLPGVPEEKIRWWNDVMPSDGRRC